MTRWLAILAVVFSATCRVDEPTTTTSAGDPPGMGRITILLTDAPLEDVEEVHVWITGVSTSPHDGPALDFDKELGDVELLSLRNRTIEVVNTEVPTGTYDFVAFRIDESRSYLVESGVTKPLAVPEGNVIVPGPFEVEAGMTTTLTLDFDAEASLTERPDGSWALQPVVVVTVSVES